MKQLSFLQKNYHFLLFIIIGLSIQSCAPVFSDIQSARTAGEGNIELTPGFSSVNYTDDDNDGVNVQDNIGIQAAYGINDKMDIRIRYENLSVADSEGSVDVLGIGLKWELLEDKLALSLPFGRAFEEGLDANWEFQPGLIYTFLEANRNFDINLGSKYIITFCDGCDNPVAFNLGFAFGKDVRKWAVRPELGLLVNPGEDDRFFQFSLGFSYNFGTFDAVAEN